MGKNKLSKLQPYQPSDSYCHPLPPFSASSTKKTTHLCKQQLVFLWFHWQLLHQLFNPFLKVTCFGHTLREGGLPWIYMFGITMWYMREIDLADKPIVLWITNRQCQLLLRKLCIIRGNSCGTSFFQSYSQIPTLTLCAYSHKSWQKIN